jgi:hypothetical protein
LALPVTAEEIRSWGVSTSVENAGRCLGLSRTQTYEALKRKDPPFPIIKVGRRIVVPTAPLLRLLGIDVDAADDNNHDTSPARLRLRTVP